MKRAEVLKIVAAAKGTAISVATMRAIPTWHAVGGAKEFHFDNLGCMGGAASTGLGLALAQPGRKVIILDGDGSLCMQLGVLVSIAGEAPKNLYHFVLVNGVYETSGAQPIPGRDTVDFPVIAKGAGYAGAYWIEDLEDLRARLPSIMNEPGPILIGREIDEEEPSQEGPGRSKERATVLRRALVGAD
jgi:phosphonopyruvate decarboxylase